jgi:hypothetical protein
MQSEAAFAAVRLNESGGFTVPGWQPPVYL